MNREQTVKIGVIGLGWPGQKHSAAIVATEQTDLFAGADSNETRRAEWQEVYPDAILYADYNEMLLSPEIDAVVICLPNFLHYPATMAAIRAGKHVLCEKPPTLNCQEMRMVLEASEEADLTYAFARQMRFNGQMRKGRELVENGRLGQIYYARTQWVRARGIPVGIGGWFLDANKAGGGVLIDIGIHALDAAWYLMGCPRPKTVTAMVSTQFRHLVDPDIPFDVDDTGFAFIRFDNGAAMHLEVSWAGNLTDEIPGETPEKRERHATVIYGRKASLRVEPLALFEDQEGKLVDIPLEAPAGRGFNEQMEDFVRAVITKTEPINSARQALYLMEMLDAMYESSATGREMLIPV